MKPISDLVKDSKHFCVLPWIHFHSWPNGNVMPCCVSNSELVTNKIKSDQSIIQMMNSEEYKKIRKNMINDQPSEECKRCYELEELGTWTMRQSHNTRRGERLIDHIESITNEDGSISDFKLKYMDVRFSNLCNMKCRSCGPGCSSLWAQEHIETKGVDDLNLHFKFNKMVINVNEDQIFMSKLKPYLKDVEEVYFAGGEVIITPEHYECLDYWLENNLQNNIELTYTTNLSVLKFKDKDLISYWKKFPKVQIWASIDSVGKKAELIRKGTEWEKIKKNLIELKQEVPHVKVEITPTISIWNVFSYPVFFDRLITEGILDKTCNPRVNILTNPWFANIMVLPEFTRKQLSLVYKLSMKKYEKNVHIFNSFKMIEYALSKGYENKEGILEFKKFNEDLDIIRKEDHHSIFPELKEIYKWAAN